MIIDKEKQNSNFKLYPLKYVTELDKYVEEIYTEPVPAHSSNFETKRSKAVEKLKETKDVPVGELYLLKHLLKNLSCYLCKNLASQPVRCQKCKEVFCKECVSQFLKDTQTVCPNCCESKTGDRCGKFVPLNN